jgi:hypothetical protein
MLSGATPSDGASCNTFVVEDSIDGENGIAEAFSWATRISKREGAPTLILSKLRAKGSVVNSGGTSSGVCSFARVFDEICNTMLRPSKKNGVGVAFLSADHPELGDWLKLAPTLKRLYTGVLFYPGVSYSKKTIEQIAEAYENHRITYVCKVTMRSDGELLYPNVCTEIRQPHKGLCTLAAIKIYDFVNRPTNYWIQQGAMIGTWMCQLLMEKIKPIAWANSDLYQFEPQVGIGLVGFANLLGLSGVRYLEMADSIDQVLDLPGDTDMEWAEGLLSLQQQSANPAVDLWVRYCLMVISIKQNMPGVTRIFTQQPTAHTALRLRHIQKGFSYSVAPEIAPPYAVRGSDGLSRATQQSELRGDRELTYHPDVEVRDDVPAEVYQRVSEGFQAIWDRLDCGHTLSHSTYVDSVTPKFIYNFLRESNLGSLYYRLDPTPAATFDKTRTWDNVGDLGDLLDFDLTPPAPQEGTCSIQSKGTCESCSM